MTGGVSSPTSAPTAPFRPLAHEPLLGRGVARALVLALVVPMALIGAVALVGGQLLLEQVFGFSTALSVVIEFTGGILFLYLLLKGSLK